VLFGDSKTKDQSLLLLEELGNFFNIMPIVFVWKKKVTWLEGE